MVPIIFLVFIVLGHGESKMLEEQQDDCIWQVYDCYKELIPIYHAIQSFNLEPLSKGRNLINICRKLPLAMQCQNAYKCDASEGTKKYLQSSTEIYNFVCNERVDFVADFVAFLYDGGFDGAYDCRHRLKNDVCNHMLHQTLNSGSGALRHMIKNIYLIGLSIIAIKMERKCWKNLKYKQSLKECTSEFKLKSQNEVCSDISILKNCLSDKIIAIDDCSVLAEIFIDYLVDKVAVHFIGNAC